MILISFLLCKCLWSWNPVLYIFVIIRAAVVMVNISFPLREERIIIGDSLFAIKIALHKQSLCSLIWSIITAFDVRRCFGKICASRAEQVFAERIIVKWEKNNFQMWLFWSSKRSMWSEKKFWNFKTKFNYLENGRKWKDKFKNNTKIIFENIKSFLSKNRNFFLFFCIINISW